MSATVAMVVPSLKVLDMVTELPTFTGMSRMRPEMVERTSVVLPLLLEVETPSRTISRVLGPFTVKLMRWILSELS